MEALIADSPIVPGLLTEYILKGKDEGCFKSRSELAINFCMKKVFYCLTHSGTSRFQLRRPNRPKFSS